MGAFAWRYLVLATRVHNGFWDKLFRPWQLISIGSVVGTVCTASARLFNATHEQSLRPPHTV